MKTLTFDSVIQWLCQKLPLAGPKIGSYYTRHTWFQRFVKFVLSTFVVFWVVKGPIMWVLTDVLGVWYVLSAFAAGVIVTIMGFVLSEFWVWRKNEV
jgi:putative flippase GtrA